MSLRLPTQTIKSQDLAGEVGAGSVAGGVAVPFLIPLDTDNVLVKFTASISGGGASAIFQTSDDGGTTFYDVARTSVVSNANNTTAQFLSIPTISPGVRTGVTFAGASIISAGVGSAAASTLAAGQVSGLPIMGQSNRVFVVLTAAVSASSLMKVEVKANNQNSSA